MKIEELEKILMTNPKYRKVRWEGQWDFQTESAHALMEIRLKGALTQKELARKMKTLQPLIARAERNGCSLEFLNRAAKATKMVVKIDIQPANPLT